MIFWIPFSQVVGKRKRKLEVRIPFSHAVGKRKTKLEVRIPFSQVVGKRFALRYTHSYVLDADTTLDQADSLTVLSKAGTMTWVNIFLTCSSVLWKWPARNKISSLSVRLSFDRWYRLKWDEISLVHALTGTTWLSPLNSPHSLAFSFEDMKQEAMLNNIPFPVPEMYCVTSKLISIHRQKKKKKKI